MDRKLAEFRSRRRREELLQKTKSALSGMFSLGQSEPTEGEHVRDKTTEEAALLERERLLAERRTSLLSTTSSEDTIEADAEPQPSKDVLWLDRAQMVVLALLWVTLLGVAFHLGLALAYMLLSAPCMLYLSTRTRPRRQGELSAYSVFNPNCERIDGTLTAEQFEREIRGMHI